MRLTLGISPCPNDTFIFDALINSKIDTGDLQFEVVFGDVEELNNKSLSGQLDITKVSFNAFMRCQETYILLDSGSALGVGCGPLVISSDKNLELNKDSVVAVPGEMTTANLLFTMAYPEVKNKETMIFSCIEDAVLDSSVDAGVIIHENRFTYLDRGLHSILDLGDFWESKTSLPIPLGGIVIKRNIPRLIQNKVQRLISDSLNFAISHPDSSEDFVLQNSQEMDYNVVKNHINLYVNDFSFSLGKAGREAVLRLWNEFNMNTTNIFLSSE